MGLNVIIPYKRDKHEGTELKYALRSIEKYLTGYDKVIIIGDLLKWYNGDYMPDSDFPDRKEYSIKEKIMKACNNEHISKDFVKWDDDVFLLKSLDVSEIKYWYNHSLEKEHELARGGYKSSVKKTLEGFPNGKNFDLHTPIVFNKEKFKEIMIWKSERCIKSTYCNALAIEGEHMEDIKINRVMNQDEIKERVNGKLFFSTGPIAVDYNLTEVLEGLYPEKSKWEK